ncbi:hypothetical protein L226DRAFT_577067 [Lentinus tigrinus ALCF2SS1-7]|uniref:uncharacterized protein n=1 Tax=Lentinus tigrinus ALCF2SS1-7 TaxID=1328758 RepID=UPI001166167F|nr:hypothetical protein L226DRAFT_577067 [Lentinus tigrinus ALCF2SS1-7]
MLVYISGERRPGALMVRELRFFRDDVVICIPTQEIVFVPAAGTQVFAIVGNVQDFASTYGTKRGPTGDCEAAVLYAGHRGAASHCKTRLRLHPADSEHTAPQG